MVGLVDIFHSVSGAKALCNSDHGGLFGGCSIVRRRLEGRDSANAHASITKAPAHFFHVRTPRSLGLEFRQLHDELREIGGHLFASNAVLDFREPVIGLALFPLERTGGVIFRDSGA
jgi:hypothetical protein